MLQDYKYSAHLGYLFTELPFRERFPAARRHGFAAIEHPAPYNVPAGELVGWLDEIQLPYVQFGLSSGDASRGEKGIAIFPERRSEFRESVAVGLDYAQAIGVRMVHAMAGILEKGERTGAHRDCYFENLAFAADAAAERDITILIEAMSAEAVPNYYIELPAQGAATIAAIARPNVKLLFDCFHTASSGLDVVSQIETHAALIGHVHIADRPGRNEPGTGGMDFPAIRNALEAASYRGFLGCEYVPRGRTEEGFGWMAA